MKQSIFIFYLVVLLSGCHDNPGQYRHDPNHHEKMMQNNRD
ncbi:MAG: membrane lipoprotein lipid attachment site-containing protein [Gammaproteobacteria bacterium]